MPFSPGITLPTCQSAEPLRGLGRARLLADWRMKSRSPRELGKLLEELEPYAASLPYEFQRSEPLRVARRDFEKAIKVPSDYVARASAFGATAYDAWKRARPANDFATMVPFLERAIDLGREYADFFAPYEHVADPLIDDADEGMTTASIRTLFAELRSELVPIVRGHMQPTASRRRLPARVLRRSQSSLILASPWSNGLATTLIVAASIRPLHPFCTRLSAGDVRITTRVYESDIRAGAILKFARGRACALRAGRQSCAGRHPHWDEELRSACMRASLDFGKT